MFPEVTEFFSSGTIEEYIPEQYRHYFYLGLSHKLAYKYKGDINRLNTMMQTMPELYRGYMYYGFLPHVPHQTRISAEGTNQAMQNMLDFYDGVGGSIPLSNEEDLESAQKYLSTIPAVSLRHYVWGSVQYIFGRNLLLHSAEYLNQAAEKTIDELFKYTYDDVYAHSICEGLGIVMSLRTFGELRTPFDTLPFGERIMPYVTSLYRGYGVGLALRFGRDEATIERLTQQYIPLEYQNYVYEGWQEGLSFLSIPTVSDGVLEGE